MPVVDDTPDQGPVVGEDAVETPVDPTLALEAEVKLWKDRAENMKAKAEAALEAHKAARDEADSLNSELSTLRSEIGPLREQSESLSERESYLVGLEAEKVRLLSEAAQLKKRWMSRPISEYIQELEGQVAFYKAGYPGEPPVVADEPSPEDTTETAIPPGGLSDDDS